MERLQLYLDSYLRSGILTPEMHVVYRCLLDITMGNTSRYKQRTFQFKYLYDLVREGIKYTRANPKCTVTDDKRRRFLRFVNKNIERKQWYFTTDRMETYLLKKNSEIDLSAFSSVNY